MTAYEMPNLRFSLPAGAAVAIHRFVKVDANGAGVLTGAKGAAVGVSMNECATGEVLEVADGIVMVEAGAEVAAGASISSDANGKAITATDGVVIGTALTAAGAAGVLVAVKL